MAEAIPLSQVPKDHSTTNIKGVYNPLTEDFKHKFDGEVFTCKTGKYTLFPENVAIHMAKHLARQIVTVVAAKERAELVKKMEGTKSKIDVEKKPFPRFNSRVAKVAKLIIGSASKTTKIKKEVILNKASEKSVIKSKKREIKLT